MLSYSRSSGRHALQQAIPNNCAPPKHSDPANELTLGVQAAGRTPEPSPVWPTTQASAASLSISNATVLQAALDDAFTPTGYSADDQGKLYQLPITKHWLKQAALALTLLCHSSYRGVHEFCRDLLGVNVSIGTVHNVVHDAIDKARTHNHAQNLANIRIAGLDEILSKSPARSRRCRHAFHLLLFTECRRAAATATPWAPLRLMECQDRGFAPDATIADFGTGIRAARSVPCPARRVAAMSFMLATN